MKNKIIIITLSVLSIFFITCGIFGIILHKKETNNISTNKPETQSTKGITYKYYLEDEEVNDLPKNEIITNEDGTTTIDTKYIFKKFTCSNNINGNFDSEKWEFIPDKNENGTCSLFFVKSKYNVKLTLNNAIEDENNSNTIERENNAVFKIKPYEGYIFKDATCSNNKDATWNEKDQTITLDVVMQDTECNVNFERKQITINIIVKNGSGNVTENVYFGDDKTIIVTPKEGYKDATISCTNNQTSVFNNNTLYFEKLTNNTTCTVTYKKATIATYTLIMDEIPTDSSISLISEKNQNIKAGESGKIILRTTNEQIPSLDCGNTIPSVNELESTDGAKTIEYVFHEMNSNISCKISN